MGEYNTSQQDDNERWITVTEIITFGYQFGHCCYHDIALIRLAETLTRTEAIDFIPLDAGALILGDPITILGWGKQAGAPRNPILQLGQTHVSQLYPLEFATQGGAQIGGGDSGGPAVAQYNTLAGASSSVSDTTSYYVAIAHYRQQIEEAIVAQSRSRQPVDQPDPCPSHTVEIEPGICLEIEPDHYAPIYLPIIYGEPTR